MLHMSIQVSGEHPAFPAQWLYGLYDFVLVTGFLATIISFSFRFRELDASTGASDPNDFAVRKCRARQSPPHVHRSLPLVCDDGQRPSGGTGCAELNV
jgi:hypothetical protein